MIKIIEKIASLRTPQPFWKDFAYEGPAADFLQEVVGSDWTISSSTEVIGPVLLQNRYSGVLVAATPDFGGVVHYNAHVSYQRRDPRTALAAAELAQAVFNELFDESVV